MVSLDTLPTFSEIGYTASRHALRLFAWHEVDNFGDRLGPTLFHRVSERPVYIEARKLRPAFEGPAREIHCFLGTLAHLLEGPHRFVLWGFGAAPAEGPAHHGCRPMARGLDLDVRALRGSLTRAVLEEAGYRVPHGVALGDPGLLLPAVYPRSPLQVDDFCLVPHHTDYDEWRWQYPGFNVIDIRTPSYEALGPLILEITRYKAIFTSSLHVAILAEAFGIPVRPMAPKLRFKFDDFYSAAGKRPRYLPETNADADWRDIYEETVRSWEPIRWDPRPWLAAAPFPVPVGLEECLSRHYRDLQLRGTGREWSGPLPWNVWKYYSMIANARKPERPAGAQERTELRRFGADDWYACGPGDGPVAEANGHGLLLRGGESVRHVATRFLGVIRSSEVVVRVSVLEVKGNAQIIVQDEQYQPRATAFVLEGDAPGVKELSIAPAPPGECLRVCVLIFSGSVAIGDVEWATVPR